MTGTWIFDVLVPGAGTIGLALANELLRLRSPARCIWNCGKREVRGKSHPLTASSMVRCPARHDERGRTFARYML